MQDTILCNLCFRRTGLINHGMGNWQNQLMELPQAHRLVKLLAHLLHRLVCPKVTLDGSRELAVGRGLASALRPHGLPVFKGAEFPIVNHSLCTRCDHKALRAETVNGIEPTCRDQRWYRGHSVQKLVHIELILNARQAWTFSFNHLRSAPTCMALMASVASPLYCFQKRKCTCPSLLPGPADALSLSYSHSPEHSVVHNLGGVVENREGLALVPCHLSRAFNDMAW